MHVLGWLLKCTVAAEHTNQRSNRPHSWRDTGASVSQVFMWVLEELGLWADCLASSSDL